MERWSRFPQHRGLPQGFAHRHRSDAGLVLPLATTAAMVLLLSSLSLLGTTLAGSLAQGVEAQRRQRDDALNSAAQLVVDQLQTSHACLAPIPSSRWDPLPPACDSLVGSLNLGALLRVGEGNEGARLLSWMPGPETARLRLQLDPGASTSQALPAEAARTGTFVLTLDPASARVLSLRREGA